MLNCMVLDIKLVFHNWSVKIALVLTLLSFLFMTETFVKEAEEMSRIPIGMIDEDHSFYSKRLIQQLQNIETIKIYESYSYVDLNKMLKEGTIMAFFEIPLGYGEKVKEGTAKDLLKMKYAKGNEVAKILSDVVVGEFLYDICMSRSFFVYQGLDLDDKRDQEGYITYIDKIKEDEIFEFGFIIDVVNRNEQEQTITIHNSLLYHQITMAILSIMISFLLLFIVEGIVVPRGSEIEKRLRLCLGKRRFWFGHIVFLNLLLAVISIFCSIFFFCIGLLSTWNQVLYFVFTLFVYSWIMTLFWILLKRWVLYSTIYQMIGSFIILLFGGIGALGVILKNLLFILKFIPNYWLIQIITDILLLE